MEGEVHNRSELLKVFSRAFSRMEKFEFSHIIQLASGRNLEYKTDTKRNAGAINPFIKETTLNHPVCFNSGSRKVLNTCGSIISIIGPAAKQINKCVSYFFLSQAIT